MIKLKSELKKNNSTTNLRYIDVIKGIGIILVVLGHTQRPEIVLKFIQSFHMPLFFIIAGFLYKRDKYISKFSMLIKTKFNSYIKPYIIIAIFCYIIYAIIICGIKIGFGSEEYINRLIRYLIGLIYSRGTWYWMPQCSPIWFLTAIFVSNIIFYFILENKTLLKQLILLTFLLIISFILSKINFIKLPWNIDSAFLGTVFMYLGYLMKRFELHKRLKWVGLIIFPLGIFAVLSNNINYVSMNSIIYGNFLFMLLGSMLLSVCIFIFTYYLLPECRLIEWFGKNTIPILGFNFLVIYFVKSIWNIIPIFNAIELTWYVEFIFNILLLIPIIYLWNKFYPKIIKSI